MAFIVQLTDGTPLENGQITHVSPIQEWYSTFWGYGVPLRMRVELGDGVPTATIDGCTEYNGLGMPLSGLGVPYPGLPIPPSADPWTVSLSSDWAYVSTNWFVEQAVSSVKTLRITVPGLGVFEATWVFDPAAPPPPPPPPPPPGEYPGGGPFDPLPPLPGGPWVPGDDVVVPPFDAAFLGLLPDGAAPVVERFEFLTDIKTGWEGTDSMERLREVPQLYYSGTYYTSPSLAGTSYAANADRAAVLAALRGGFKVELPIAVHSHLPGDAPRAGSVGPGQRVWRHVRGEAPVIATLANERPAGWRVDYPLREGWLAEARELEHLTPGVARFALTLRCRAPVVEVFAEPPPVIPALRHNWIVSVSESNASTSDLFDNGHLILTEQRYIKRRVRIECALRGRHEIGDFRQWLWTVGGPYAAFEWSAPLDGETPGSYWRLASDAVEIEYLTRLRARVRLELIQLSTE